MTIRCVAGEGLQTGAHGQPEAARLLVGDMAQLGNSGSSA